MKEKTLVHLFCIVTFLLWVGSVGGHAYLESVDYIEQQAMHGRSVEDWGWVPGWGMRTLENIQSELAQGLWFSLMPAAFFYLAWRRKQKADQATAQKQDRILEELEQMRSDFARERAERASKENAWPC